MICDSMSGSGTTSLHLLPPRSSMKGRIYLNLLRSMLKLPINVNYDGALCYVKGCCLAAEEM